MPYRAPERQRHSLHSHINASQFVNDLSDANMSALADSNSKDNKGGTPGVSSSATGDLVDSPQQTDPVVELAKALSG